MNDTLLSTIGAEPTSISGNRNSTVNSSILKFSGITIDDISVVQPILNAYTLGTRTCDFTIGGIFMWIDYFRYEMCVIDNTIFLRGLNEKDLSEETYSIPYGRLPLKVAIDMLRSHCKSVGKKCTLSAVPEKLVPIIETYAPVTIIEPLDDWSDYLYDITRLASLTGKKMSKKRNHVNRFMADNPGWRYTSINSENINNVIEFFSRQKLAEDKSVTADFERLQVLEVLNHPDWFGFDGGVLSTPDRGIVAFAMGETVGDTLYVHIEKMDHDVAGSGETINKMFAADMLNRHPELQYVNREEDTGDLGLRAAKMSYHPSEILRKYNVTLG